MITMMLIARELGKTDYGQFVVIQSTLAMTGVVAGFGVGAAATRYAAELKYRDAARLEKIITLGERFLLGASTVTATALITGAEWLALKIFGSPALSAPLQLAAGAVIFSALDGYQKSVLVGFEDMRAFTVGTIAGVILSLPVMLIAATAYGLTGAATALSVSVFFQCLISRYQMRQALRRFKIGQNAKGSLQEWPLLWRFALPALLAGIVVSPAHWAVQAMLANTPNGFDQVAVLGVAMQWFNTIIFFPATAARVVLPILTDKVSGGDKGSSRKILIYAMSSNAAIAVPLAVLVGIFSPEIMNLYGESFHREHLALVIAAGAAVIFCLLNPVGNLLAAASRMWLGSVMNLGWAVVYVGTAFATASFGAVAILSSMGVAYLFHAIWVLIFANRYLRPR